MLNGAWWELLEDELGWRYLTELLAFVDGNDAGIFPPKADASERSI